jgi:hypothetical protein
MQTIKQNLLHWLVKGPHPLQGEGWGGVNYKHPYLLFFLFLLLISSCRKDKDEPVVKITPLIIEYTSSNIAVNDIPDTTIESFQLPHYFHIDLNSDGQDDFRFSVYNIYGYGGLVLFRSNMRIESWNSDSYIFADSIFPHVDLNGDTVIHQSTVDSLYPKVFSLGDTISIHENWERGNLNILRTGWDIPPSEEHYYEGFWWNSDKKYIGVKCKGLSGWIKIGIPDKFNRSIKIYEYALTK